MPTDPHADLVKMADGFRELSIEAAFPLVHHFSNNAFSSKPNTLESFLKYCEDVGTFREGENPQTIRRGLALCDNLRLGKSLDEAIAAAWETCPLATR